ncbi:MAG: LamG-like jellyroll fold domain-containing protein [Bacteroidales bacterium]
MKKVMKIGGALLSVMLVAGLITSSCSKSSSSNTNNGKIDPSSIAKADLIDYFNFESNGTDSVTGMTPSQQNGVTYVTGKRGMAYQGKQGAYLLYDLPAVSKLSTLKAFTVSMWFYGPNIPSDTVPVPAMFGLNGTNDPAWGNMLMTQDRLPATSDSLNLKIVFGKAGVPFNLQFVGFPNKAFTQNLWFHLIYTYDNVTSKFKTYVNGVQLNLPAGTTQRVDGATPSLPLGDLNFVGATQFALGGWIAQITHSTAAGTYMGWFKGMMDELRFYDRALTPSEATTLFDAEVTQLQ